MVRLFLTLTVATLAAAWADAQNSPLAADRVKMLHNNRALVEKLVGHSVALADDRDPLNRARTCHKALADLTAALNAAIAAQDADRVAELGDHFAALANDALAPCIEDGRIYPAGSESAPQLKLLREQTLDEMKRLELSVPRDGAFGKSQQVKDTLKKWQDAREKLENSKN
jgi:hypothetical protein